MQTSGNPTDSEKVVKIRLSGAQQRLLRVAAALENLSMSEFAKQAAIDAARAAAKVINWDELGLKDDAKAPKGRKKR